MLSSNLQPYAYTWPGFDLRQDPNWTADDNGAALIRNLPETQEQLARDSRWPAFFPSPICLVTTGEGATAVLEKVVGPSIVNRFPYILALSFCTQELSSRHHARSIFRETLEKSGGACVQFLPPGKMLDRAMDAVLKIPEKDSTSRIVASGLAVQPGQTNPSPVFKDAYLVYEARLVRPGRDFHGNAIFEKPWKDIGSHRVYFLEINAIQLREDIARGQSQVHWRSLPEWQQLPTAESSAAAIAASQVTGRYQKGYTPHYSFPSAGTVAFEFDEIRDGMAVKRLPSLPQDQVEVDNDRARWPCFFPSSVGMITSWTADGLPNLMPCGSTTLVSRHPLVIAPCVAYSAINDRYKPRASLETLRRTRRFGCGVPYISERVLQGIRYAGNVSIQDDRQKITNSGLSIDSAEWAPVLPDLPIHFECQIVDEVLLGTHVMFLGEVKRIRVRADVSKTNPLVWCPWADVRPVA